MYGIDTLKFSARFACHTNRTLVTMNVPRLPCIRKGATAPVRDTGVHNSLTGHVTRCFGVFVCVHECVRARACTGIVRGMTLGARVHEGWRLAGTQETWSADKFHIPFTRL